MSNGSDAPAPAPATPPPSYGGSPVLCGVDRDMAKKILAAGVVLYLLVTFVQNGGGRKIQVKQSELASVNLDQPVAPTQPEEPNANDYGDQKDLLEKAKKDYDAEKKKYDERMKSFNKERAEWARDSFDRKVKHEELQRDLAKMQAQEGDWSYFKYFLKFVSALAITFGLLFILFHGTDWERAVALFLLGTMVLQILER